MSSAEFACLGFQTLGMCAYNPAQPSNIYFSVGDALGVLAFTFAVQQFLKPIYRFRLRAYKLNVLYFLGAIFTGAFCAIVGLIAANVATTHASPLSYPVFWELSGGCIIFTAYALAAFISFMPLGIYSWNLVSVVRAGGLLLSGATEEDLQSIAADIFRPRNIECLILHARALENAEHRAIGIEFERLRSIGAPQSIDGRPSVSAFYKFSHRKELEKADYAATFLQIISDPDFCAVAVRRHPWPIADLLNYLSVTKLYTKSARILIQQLSEQAMIQDESLLSKEMSFGGYSNASLLSASLFGDIFILKNYEPMYNLSFRIPENPSEKFCRRLNGAARMMLQTAIANGDFWPRGYMSQLGEVYENLCRKIYFERYRTENNIQSTRIFVGIQDIVRLLQKALNATDENIFNALFTRNLEEYRTDIVEIFASVVYASFEALSRDFKGVEDGAWPYAISSFMQIFPFHENQPVGVDPLQQQLALKIIAKVKENMAGYYPAVTRLMLAVIGPYQRYPKVTGSAFALLRDAFYKEIQNLSKLHGSRPDKLADFLPENVTYDAIDNTLSYKYRLGEISVTKLSVLQLRDIDFRSEEFWRKPEQPHVG